MSKFQQIYESITKNYEADLEKYPQNVQDIRSQSKDSDDYRDIEKVLKQMKDIGWTFDYDLNGIITKVRKIK